MRRLAEMLVPRDVGRIIAILTPAERRRGVLVLVMVVGMALLEAVGVVSIMPFFAVLGNRQVIYEHAALVWLYERGGFVSERQFLFALGMAALGLILVATAWRVLTVYAMHRYAQMRRYSISRRLFEQYLRLPYQRMLGRNPADLSKTVLSEVNMLVSKVIQPAILICAHGIVALALVVMLIAVDPLLASFVAGILAAAYVGIYLLVRGILGRIGRDRFKANRERFMATATGFGGFKDLKILNRESSVIRRFDDASRRYSLHQATKAILGQVPKHLTEAAGVATLLGLTLVLMRTHGDLGQVLPVLGLYAFAGFRLLPALQNIYMQLTRLRFGSPVVESVYEQLCETADARQGKAAGEGRVTLGDAIQFEQVTFRYDRDGRAALSGIDLEIRARTMVGIVGGTGSGKTTLVDLMLGLLSPEQGRILIDGKPLDDTTLPGWQRSIGYVPQDVYLADASIKENIAFGLEPDQIDQAAVEQAARTACIHEFIVNELPHEYDTTVGERGLGLSGGQRQRLGIARALYHDPEVLVLDEATSALDTATERALLGAVAHLWTEKTIVMIAHRLSTIEAADKVVVLEGGRLVAEGPYAELLETSAPFRGLALPEQA